MAASIGECLSERGHEVQVSTVDQVDSIHDYDAIVVGSAVYAGHWLRPAIDLVTNNAASLSSEQWALE
jgi:menaquinone-dependent protoporphyrinogen oxidase